MQFKFLKHFLFTVIFSGIFYFLLPAQTKQTEGAFKPNKESFHNYQYPEWIRDAKLGF